MENEMIFERKLPRRRFMQAAALGAVSAAVVGGSASASAAGAVSGAASQTAVIEGFDWGPSVVATIIKLPCVVQPSSVRAADFAVEESKEAFDWVTYSAEHIVSTSAREVTDAYTCLKNGKRTSVPSCYIRLDMSYDPSTGAPFCYDLYTGKNTWCSPYEMSVTLKSGAALKDVIGRKVESISVDPVIDFASAKIDQLKAFDLTGTFDSSDGKHLCYAYHTPSMPTVGSSSVFSMSISMGKRPLVIWLHGAGEGGHDPSIVLLGNKATALATDEFMQAMGGSAYVLYPQTETFWLEWNSEDPSSWGANPGRPSVYTQALKELIDAFVAEHDDIDANRIYIGGCSNGGYMTLNMVLRYPDYFAAAYPICEAYRDSGISDAELEAIKNVPVWFIYAKNDTTVLPTDFEEPTIARLKAIGANLHTSIFEDVHDMTGLYKDSDGQPHQYMGHWSWLYFFNNQCTDDATGENLWAWMASQSK